MKWSCQVVCFRHFCAWNWDEWIERRLPLQASAAVLCSTGSWLWGHPVCTLLLSSGPLCNTSSSDFRSPAFKHLLVLTLPPAVNRTRVAGQASVNLCQQNLCSSFGRMAGNTSCVSIKVAADDRLSTPHVSFALLVLFGPQLRNH